MKEVRKIMIIYLHRNAVNGKVYIGQTKTLLAQRNQHDSNDYKGCGSFWNAIEKYSWDKFSYTILEKCTEILYFVKQLFLKIVKIKALFLGIKLIKIILGCI